MAYKLGEKRRSDIMEFIREYIKTHNYSPTVEEIGEAVGLASKSTTYRHLEHLRASGEITWTPNVARTIRFTE